MFSIAFEMIKDIDLQESTMRVVKGGGEYANSINYLFEIPPVIILSRSQPIIFRGFLHVVFRYL